MSIEYEVKIININVAEIKEKLIKNGAILKYELTKFYRAIFDHHSSAKIKKGYLRIRDEGSKITITSKTRDNKSKFSTENEITINENFETGLNFLKSLGYAPKAFQESYREKWSHPLVREITIDIFPGLPIYMEIECESEEKINEFISLLNLDENNKRYCSYKKLYQEYYNITQNIISEKTPYLTFNNIMNEITPTINFELFVDIAYFYLKIEKYVADKNIKLLFDEYDILFNKLKSN